MNRTMYRICLAMALIVTFVAAVAQATEVTKGNVTEVTVYRDQALITRTIEVGGPKGPLEIVVNDLPDKIIPASLSAESKGNSRIHSVTYRTKAITGETRPEVKAIDEKIAELEKQLRELNAYQELLQVKLLEAIPKISQDPEYQRTKLKKGLLRWNLEIPEQAINEKAIMVMYRFRMAHDKQMTIKGLFESR